jgi:hypothetical protein
MSKTRARAGINFLFIAFLLGNRSLAHPKNLYGKNRAKASAWFQDKRILFLLFQLNRPNPDPSTLQPNGAILPKPQGMS